MKNSCTSPFGLPFLTQLKQAREKKIDFLVNNLQFADVEKDEAFEKSVDGIKKAVQLPPVVIGPGKYVRHEFEQRNLSFEQQLMGVPGAIYHHEIAVPVSGSVELLSHTPESGTSYGGNESGLILPYGGKISVYVSLPQIENEKAVTVADNMLAMTKRFADANNASVTSWNSMVGARIDQQAAAKRKELIDKFGRK